MLGFIKTTYCNHTKNANTTLSKYKVELQNKATDINIVDWNSVLQNKHLFLSIPYLNALEKTLPNGVTTFYVIVYEKNTPIFITYLQLYTFTKEQLNALKSTTKSSNVFLQYFKNCFQNILIKVIQLKKMQLLVMGNILQTGDYTLISKQNDRNAIIINTIIDKIKTIHKVDATILKDFNCTTEIESALQQQRFLQLYTQPNMALSLNESWVSFDNYIKDLNTKYKKRWKSTKQKFGAVQKQIFKLEDIITYEIEMYQLFEQVYQNSNFKINKIKSNYFIDFKNQFATQFNVIGYFLNNKLIAFASFFVDDNELEANYIGLNYDYNSSHKLYQNILYDYIQFAIDNNCKKLYLSRTGLEIKSTIGAIPEFLNNFIRLENKVLHYIIKPVFKNIKQEPFEQRNPFK